MEDAGSDEDEELDFWGGDTSRSPRHVHTGEDSEESEASDDDTMSIDDEDEDDEDEEDHMALFGHR